MRTFFIIPLIFMVILLIVGCCTSENKNEPAPNPYEKILGGEHPLRKFNVNNSIENKVDAWYFLVVGQYSSQNIENTKVRFYFLNCKNEYQLLEFPLEKVNIKVDTNAMVPFVKFYWNNHNRDETQYNQMYENDITRVVIHCRENDFQPSININNLK